MNKIQLIKFTKKWLKDILNKLPYVRTLHKLNSNSKFPSGHYYSTVICLEDIKKRQNGIWKLPLKDNIRGIDLNIVNQLSLLEKLKAYYNELPFEEVNKKGLRYILKNNFYSYNDGIILHLLIRHFQPKKIIEIGSGHSSAVMMDTNQLFFNGTINLTFIEPHPGDRLSSLMTEEDAVNTILIGQNVQNISLELFKGLQKDDFLFIDSSHAVKTGSDVNYILFEILPILSPGVLIHFHDIYFPFEYPKSWVLDGFGWNETYFLKAFLMYNKSFELLLFSDYLHSFYKDAFKDMPLTYKSTGSSFWMKKI